MCACQSYVDIPIRWQLFNDSAQSAVVHAAGTTVEHRITGLSCGKSILTTTISLAIGDTITGSHQLDSRITVPKC